MQKPEPIRMPCPAEGLTLTELSRWYSEPTPELTAGADLQIHLLFERNRMELELEGLRLAWRRAESDSRRTAIEYRASVLQQDIELISQEMPPKCVSNPRQPWWDTPDPAQPARVRSAA